MRTTLIPVVTPDGARVTIRPIEPGKALLSIRSPMLKQLPGVAERYARVLQLLFPNAQITPYPDGLDVVVFPEIQVSPIAEDLFDWLMMAYLARVMGLAPPKSSERVEQVLKQLVGGETGGEVVLRKFPELLLDYVPALLSIGIQAGWSFSSPPIPIKAIIIFGAISCGVTAYGMYHYARAIAEGVDRWLRRIRKR